MNAPGGPVRVKSWVAALLALVASLGPVTVQAITLVMTQSVTTTLLVAAVVACLFILVGMRYQAYVFGSLEAVPGGAIVGLVLAVVTYNLIALPMAILINARFFVAAAAH